MGCFTVFSPRICSTEEYNPIDNSESMYDSWESGPLWLIFSFTHSISWFMTFFDCSSFFFPKSHNIAHIPHIPNTQITDNYSWNEIIEYILYSWKLCFFQLSLSYFIDFEKSIEFILILYRIIHFYCSEDSEGCLCQEHSKAYGETLENTQISSSKYFEWYTLPIIFLT